MTTPAPPAPAPAPLAALLTAPAASGNAPERWPDRLWRYTIDFLPFLLALALLLATIWLVRSMPQAASEAPARPLDKPDYFMRDFRVRNFDAQGVLQTELKGAYGDHLPVTDTVRTRTMQSYSRDAKGNETRAWADRSESDRKGARIELFDNVKVIRTSAATLAATSTAASPPSGSRQTRPVQIETSYLQLINQQEHIRTDRPVRITQGQDVMTGSGLEYTGSTKVLNVQGRVQAQIQPAAIR